MRKRQRQGVCGLTDEEFSDLMQLYQGLVYRVCYQFVQEPHTAEDLTQDTFLTAYKCIESCNQAAYKQWLIRVAVNKCRDYLKSAWVRHVGALYQEDDETDLLSETTAILHSGQESKEQQRDPLEILVEKSSEQALRNLILNLRQPYGPVARMYFLEDLSIAQIATMLNRPPSTVKNQLWRAKAILREQIMERKLI